jgi:hypothetical protein
MVSQFIFISPVFVFYVPPYGVLDFILIIMIASLSGIVASLSIYRIRLMGLGLKKSGTGFAGSILGASTGACSCGSFGFAIVSIFGPAGGAATALLTNYEIPLRIISIAILCYTYYTSVKGITTQCSVIK